MYTGALLVKREDERNDWSHLYPELRVATSKVQGIPVAVWRQQSVHPSVLEVWREGRLSQRHGRGQMWVWVFSTIHISSVTHPYCNFKVHKMQKIGVSHISLCLNRASCSIMSIYLHFSYLFAWVLKTCICGNSVQYSEMYFKHCREPLKHSESVHLLSQAARESAPLTFTSVAAVSVWNPAWCVTALPTARTVQMKAWDALNATAPAHQLLSVTTTVSAHQMDRSVALLCPKLNLSMLSWNGKQATLGTNSSLTFHSYLFMSRAYFISLLQLENCV